MQLVRRFRLPALFCALAVLVCELVSRPFVDMGVSDDGPYILMAHILANTGHIAYNGWAAPMLGWQLYLGAAFIKLFGFSFTVVRMSILFVAMMLAFVLQRALVRAGITERNATLGSLAFVLSPLYLLLSAPYLTDITGLFGIVLCLYSCLRALRSSAPRATILWLCVAVATNAIFGSSRQIAWLGILVMIPSTLWLLRSQRRVLLVGTAANITGVVFIIACLQWLRHQPYSVPEHLLVSNFSAARATGSLLLALLEIPFLLLPIAAVFLTEIRRSRIRVLAVVAALAFALLATYPSHLRGLFSPLLEPTLIDWVTVYGIYQGSMLNGQAPILLPTALRVLLTVISFGGLIGLVVAILRARSTPPLEDSSAGVSLKQLGVLLAPVSIVYTILLIPRAASFALFDRYLLELLVFALLYLVRFYQDRIHSRLPRATALLIAGMAIYGIVVTHNNFAFYRARVALAEEFSANGAPDTSVDNGWEYNLAVELQHADHINDPVIVVPAHAYTPVPPPPGPCQMFWYNYTPHIHPLYGISFDPNACDGPAPFAPVHYARWPYLAPGTLYAVKYTAPSGK